MNRRTYLKTIALAGAGSATALRAGSVPGIELHVDLDVDPGRVAEMLNNYRTKFLPAITKQPGFHQVKLLKLNAAMQGPAPANTSYRLVICFDTEEQRKAWVATPVHQKVWPTIEQTLRGSKFSAVLFDVAQ